MYQQLKNHSSAEYYFPKRFWSYDRFMTESKRAIKDWVHRARVTLGKRILREFLWADARWIAKRRNLLLAPWSPNHYWKMKDPLHHQGTTRAIISMDQRPNSVGLFTNAHTLADSTFWCMSAPSTPVVRHSRQSNRIAIRFRTLKPLFLLTARIDWCLGKEVNLRMGVP